MNSRWSFDKFSAVGLGVALLVTQSLFAYEPEKSFWAQRRQAARRTHAPVLTSFPLGRSGEGSLAAQFPSPQLLRSSLSQTVARSVPKSFVKDHAPLLASLSPAHGTVRKVSLGLTPAPAGPVVVHIQDVHMNAEAQGNIRETLAGLLNSGQVGLIALEGSTKDIVLQPFVDFPNRKAVESSANYLLKENKISGPIHAAMTAQRQLPRILGIDDPVHYAANVQAYKDSAPKLEETRLRVIKQQKELDEQKKTVFSPALLTLDQTVTGYRNDKVSLGNYVLALHEAVQSLKISTELKIVGLFLNALKIERTLDFKQVEMEREQLIDRLTRSLNNQEINSLMAQSIAYRTGELRYGDFYAQLKETCQKKGIRLSDFPAMDEYIRYILLVDGIDADQLLNEIASLEKSAYGQLANSPEQKALVARSRHLWLTARLVGFSLMPQEWQEYKVAGRQDTNLAPFESFYQEAETRDTAMAQNLLSALNSRHSKTGSVTAPIAVLVTGGFHADGIAQQLNRQGITVLSYVPKIEKVDTTQGSAYLSVFTQEKTPLEKMFQGKKLFLSPDTVTATKTLAPPLVVGMDTLTGERGESLIEKEEALLSFLKETTGEDVQVKVNRIGENLDDGSVNVSIRLGEKETQIKIKTGPQFEILSVDGFSPAPPSLLAHWLMRGFARLHTWLGPAAHRVVKFTEAIPLSRLPLWTAANKAWWLTFHPTIKSVSDVVWQLAFLEAAATAMHQVQRKASSSFLNPIRAMWAQMVIHSGFNAVSPIKATGTVSGRPTGQSSKIVEIKESPFSNVSQREARRKFNLYRGVFINSNFAALELIDLHMGSMSRSVAEAILGHVEQMVDVFVEISPQKGQTVRKSFYDFQASIEAELAQLAENVELPSKMLRVFTTGVGETKWEPGKPIPTLRALINWVHQQGAEDIRDVIKSAEANLIIEVGQDKKINVANLSDGPLFVDGKVVSRPLECLLAAVRRTTRTDLYKETYVLLDNYLYWSSKLGNHRAEVTAELLDPDSGGNFHLRYFEGSNERPNKLRIDYFIHVLQQLGVHVAPPETNNFNQYLLNAVLDKDHGAKGVRHLATALTLTLSALHDSKSLDHSLDAMGLNQSADYVERTIFHMAEILIAEGYLPFFKESRSRWDQAMYRAYLTYLAEENVRIAQRDKLNEQLKGLDLPLIPTNIIFGERVVEIKYTDVLARALARGQLVLGKDATPEKNPLHNPIPELIQFILENEAEAMRTALTLDLLSKNIIPLEPMGSVGNLLAVTGEIELENGEWFVVRGLRDATRGHLLYADCHRGDGKGKLYPLDLKRAVKLLKKEGHFIVPAEEPSDPQKMVARRLLSAPFKGSRAAVALKGLPASGGQGQTQFGQVTFNRHYLDERAPIKNAVVVLPFTTPDDLPVIQSDRTLAVVTTGGGLLSHAGITTREFNKTAVILTGAELIENDGNTVLRYSVFTVGDTEKDENGLWIGKNVVRQEVEIREGDVVLVNGRDGVVIVFDRQSQRFLEGVLARLKKLMTGEGDMEDFSHWLISSVNVGTFPAPVVPDMLEFIFSSVFDTAITQLTGPSREILEEVASLRKQAIPPREYERLNAVIERAFQTKMTEFQASLERLAHQVEETKQPGQAEEVIAQLLKRLRELTNMGFRLSIAASERTELLGLEGRLKLIRQLNHRRIVRLGIKVHRKASEMVAKPIFDVDLHKIRQLTRIAARYGFPSGKTKKVVCVCTGNTDRSPITESLFKRYLGEKGLKHVVVLSRGLQAKPGQPISQNAKLVLDDMNSKHVASPLTAEDLVDVDLVLAMTQDHVDSLLKLYPHLRGKVARLNDYGEIEGGGDVEDPFGKDMATYLKTKEEIDLAVKGVLNRFAGAEALGKLIEKEKTLTNRKLRALEEAHRFVYSLSELDEDFVGVVGGKSAKLGQIAHMVPLLGMHVPNLIANSIFAFDRFLDENKGMRKEYVRLTSELDAHLGSGLSDLQRKRIVQNYSDSIRNLIFSGEFDMGKRGLGYEIRHELTVQKLHTKHLAERSSAIQEDTQGAAFAGAAETFLYVPPAAHLEKIKEIWMSFYLPRGIEYRFAHGYRQAEVKPSTSLQEMVDSEVAGVVFSINPITGEDEVFINSSWGLGEAVVSGLVQGDLYTARKSDGAENDFPFIGSKRTKIVRHDSGAGTKHVAVGERDRNRRSLSASQVRQLTQLSVMMETYFGYPVDIEFAFSKGKFYVLQVRPVTTNNETERRTFDRGKSSSTPDALDFNPSEGSMPLSILDPLLRAIVRLLDRMHLFRIARSVDGFRRGWNATLGPFLETLLFFNVAAAAGMGPLAGAALVAFPLAHAAMEIIFDVLLGRGSAKAVVGRLYPRLIWGALFALPFLPIALGVPIPLFSAELFGFSFIMNPIVWGVSVGHAVKNIWSDLKVRALARADARKAADIVRRGNEMGLDDLRALLLPKIETPAIEQLSPGLAFSSHTAQKLRDDFEYRHEFVQAYRKELTNDGRPLPSIRDVFWSFHQVSTAGATATPAAKEDNAIQVIEEIISDRDLDKAKDLIDRIIRTNGGGSAAPFKLRLISADPAVRENLERMVRGNPHIFVRSVELDATRLAEDFDRWRIELGLQKVPMRLVIGVSEGVAVAGTVAGNSLYSIALRVALSGIPVRPADIENMLQIAEAVTENA